MPGCGSCGPREVSFSTTRLARAPAPELALSRPDGSRSHQAATPSATHPTPRPSRPLATSPRPRAPLRRMRTMVQSDQRSTGAIGLGVLAGATVGASTGLGISSDGAFVVGDSPSSRDREAFLWDQADGMIPLSLDEPNSAEPSPRCGCGRQGCRWRRGGPEHWNNPSIHMGPPAWNATSSRRP
jgi:hypothetical protein